MSHHNNSNIFSVILFSFFSFLFFTAFIFFFIIRYSYNFINKYYSVFCIHKIFGIQKFFVNKYYSVLVIRKFFIKEDIWSSVFGNFSWTKIFDLRSSEIFHERRSSVFGIRKFLKNEDLRSSVFGNFSWTKIFGLRYSVKITLRCNSDPYFGESPTLTWIMPSQTVLWLFQKQILENFNKRLNIRLIAHHEWTSQVLKWFIKYLAPCQG